MRNLIIDIGNTRIKSAVFEQGILLEDKVFDELTDAIIYWETLFFDQSLVSSVRWGESDLAKKLPFSFIYLNHETSLPIANMYGTPATLGLDRIAGAIGAWSMRRKGPVLAIDLGTCMTFDLIDGQNAYLGGAISPGLAMRARAMHEQTARLPLVDLHVKPDELIGANTITCMQIGIWLGVELEILGQIEAYTKKYPEIEVFISGGDAQSFVSLAKDLIFVVPNLVLYGLNSILNHNVE
ncbi:type III pantothenate kinase [Algoriphagus sp. AGSA1]|uniref:type III pantothenate kinase n=1 Tax=Algoriphagus sp. AGSA1 TaxID=2907213 RepID=UPI001F3008E8|nr:type III pantothenate kinase [Algoriphagus sp. AGSA1]MCE7056351.1 type III pantothenate kinase [Algoriphagus sp. AGSA1]